MTNGQAQGIPLFAMETVRSLIDRDLVQPIDGVYRLVGQFGELTVPDSLHAPLAARLDALEPGVRRLVADAAVLGTFAAQALIAVSGQSETAVRAGGPARRSRRRYRNCPGPAGGAGGVRRIIGGQQAVC